MTFLGKILAKIGSLFTSAEKEIQKVIIPAAIAVTNMLKSITELDSTDLLGSLAGAAGSAFEDKLRRALPAIVQDLQLAQAFLSTNPTPDALLSEVLKVVQTLPLDTKTAFLIEFSGKVAKVLADGKITIAEAIILAQDIYHRPVATPVVS